MYLDTSVNGDKTKDVVSINGVTAFSQLIVDAFQIAVYHQHILVFTNYLLLGILIIELLRTASGNCWSIAMLEIIHLDVFLYYLIEIELVFCQLLIEISRFLESHLLDQMRHRRLLHLHLSILETPLKHLFGI